MAKEDACEPTIHIDRGDGAEVEQVVGVDGFGRWLAREEEFWAWLTELRGHPMHSPFRSGLSGLQSLQATLLTKLQELRDSGKQLGKIEPVLSQGASDALKTRCRNGYVVSVDPRARIIESIRQEAGSLTAAWALAYVLDRIPQKTPLATQVLKGAVWWELLAAGGSPDGSVVHELTEQRRQVESQQRSLEAAVARAEDDASALGSEFEALRTRLSAEISERKTTLDQAVSDAEQALGQAEHVHES